MGVDSKILGKRIRALVGKSTSAELDTDKAVPGGVLIVVVWPMVWEWGGHMLRSSAPMCGFMMGLHMRGGRGDSGRAVGDGEKARGWGGVDMGGGHHLEGAWTWRGSEAWIWTRRRSVRRRTNWRLVPWRGLCAGLEDTVWLRSKDMGGR